MTGLDPARHTIVEIACLITDDNLALIEEGPDLVVHATPEQLADMDDFVRTMHTRSGLLAEIEASTLSLADAGAQTLAFLQSHIPRPARSPWRGTPSGRTGASWPELPAIEDFLNYRSVDVSTIKELCRRWLPDIYKAAPRSRAATGPCRTSASPWRSWPTTAGGLRPRRGEREGEHVSTTGKDAPSMSIAEANADPHRRRAALRDGRARHPRRADADLEERAALARAVIDMSLGHGDNVFLVYEDERTTFAEHYRIACTLAHRLRTTFGIEQGDRVAIIMRNLPEWVMAFWGATLAGAIVVPLNAWWSGEELRYGLEDSGSKVAFVDTERVERIRPFLGGLPDLSAVIVADEHRTEPAAPLAVSEPSGGAPSPNGRSRWPWAPSTRPPRRPTSPSTRRTTPPSSTRRAPPAGPRVRSAPTGTCAPT